MPSALTKHAPTPIAYNIPTSTSTDEPVLAGFVVATVARSVPVAISQGSVERLAWRVDQVLADPH